MSGNKDLARPQADQALVSDGAAKGVSTPTGFDPSRCAVISECGNYRYVLERRWASERALDIIMLNPSTADADVDDPTIRRCISFAKREGFGGIKVMNLFAYRATSPADMLAQASPYGPDNDRYLTEMLVAAARAKAPVLAAWGAHGVHGTAKRVQTLAKHYGAQLVCLGKTNGGHPRHPLYVRGDQPFVPLASAGEAGTADTPKSESVHEHAVPKGDAHA